MTRKEWLMILILAALNFTHILDFMLIMPLGVFLMPKFGIDPSQFSWLVSSYTFAAAVASLAGIFFVDYFDRKKVLLICYAGFVLGTLLCGLANSYEMMLCARIFAGLFGGLIGSQVMSIVADNIEYSKRGRAMGAVMGAFALAAAVGIPMALFLANAFSWHTPFFLVAGMGLPILCLIYFYLPNMTGHIALAKQSNVWEALHINKPKLMGLAFTFLIVLGHFLIIPFLNPYMEKNNGYAKSVTPFIYLVIGVCSIAFSNAFGYLADKKGKLPVYIFCCLLSLIPIYFITSLQAETIWLMLLLFGIWAGLVGGRTVSYQSMLSQVVPPESRGRFMSLNSFVNQIAAGLAANIAGYVVTENHITGKLDGYYLTGWISIAALLLSLAFATSLNKYLSKK
jgi:MFS transporter, DHA1 family, inner membrane transport protein